MTRRSRGIHAAWHFLYAVSFSGESGLRKVGLCGTHPLTRRYMPVIKKSIAAIISFLNVLSSLTGVVRILVGTLAIC
ncbi:TPA: DUF3265 domain-containing protein [Vibrio vulnificus]|nr:DUF3265 domain-containing protein [Vibrio vulnificus]HDY8211383.1 DUF3265 domain-containing protein [Vibrio vulnificus]